MKKLFILFVALLLAAGCSDSDGTDSQNTTKTDTTVAQDTAVNTDVTGQDTAVGADTAGQEDTGSTADTAATGDATVKSSKPRVPSKTGIDDLKKLSTGNNTFAFDLYQEIKDADSNMFFSPISISLALAMTYGGANGKTAEEMKKAMRFRFADSALHAAFNALDQTLESRRKIMLDGKEVDGFSLNIVNQLWGRLDVNFEAPFLDNLAENYGAGLRLLDFKNSPDPSRLVINDWVADQTADRIKDLLPEGSIDHSTYLVLTNAIYFKADWATKFDEKRTAEGDFQLLDGKTSKAQFMENTGNYQYVDGKDHKAVELDYIGHKLSMVIIMPTGKFAEFDDALTSTKVDEIIESLSHKRLNLKMPKFEFTKKFALSAALQKLGMKLAFSNSADFSKMTKQARLQISSVVHKAFVKVDEEGTEAAGATAVVMSTTSVPPPPTPFSLDRPFILLIRDKDTNATLFIGRITEP